jgi:hypothetical protein
MDDLVFLTGTQAGALVDRISVGESGRVPFGAPNRSGATVDIIEGESELTREASDRFVLRTQWAEYVPGHGYGQRWEEVEVLDRDEAVRRFTWARAPRDLIDRIDRSADWDWRSVRWPNA